MGTELIWVAVREIEILLHRMYIACNYRAYNNIKDEEQKLLVLDLYLLM